MSWQARLKRQLAIYGGTAGVVLVVLGLVLVVAAGWVYLNPPTEQPNPTETNVQSFGVDLDHSGVVTGNSSLYERGEVLENKPVYFTNATPALRLETDIDVPDDRDVTVNYRLSIHHEGTFNGEPFWERTVNVTQGSQTVTGGGATIETDLDVAGIRSLRETAQDEAGTIGTFSSVLRLTVDYSSPVGEGGRYEGTLSASSPMQFVESAYWFDQELSASETRSQTGPVEERELPPDLVTVGLLALLGLLAVAGGVGLAGWSSRRADVYDLELEVYRSKYDEWISEGEFPTDDTSRYVFINSLKDLVDIAIDTNKRVIYDDDVEVFSVLDGDVVYYHAAEPRSIASWLDTGRETSGSE